MSPPGLPRLTVNMAMTADGKIATANRRVASFGSARDLEHLRELRAQADAILCGARTVDVGKVVLGVGPSRFRRQRLRRALAEYPLRVIVSGAATIHPDAAIFRRRFSPVIVLCSGRADPGRLRRLRGVADAVEVFGSQTLDFSAALRWLAAEWGVRRLLCEGGGELNAGLFRAGLVHELHLTICPFIFGGARAPTIADGAMAAALGDAVAGRLKSRRRSGDELFLVYTFGPRGSSARLASSQSRSLSRLR